MLKPFSWSATVGAIAALNLCLISPARAQIRQITHVDILTTYEGLVIHLEAPNAEQVTILQTELSNETILDLLVTQLGAGLAADQAAPASGIDQVSVAPLDTNSVRIHLVGSGGAPIVDISRDDTRIVLNVTPSIRLISCRHCPQPDYIVRLIVEFDAEGYVTEVFIDRSSGNALVDQAALEAAWDYEFDIREANSQGSRVPIEYMFYIE